MGFFYLCHHYRVRISTVQLFKTIRKQVQKHYLLIQINDIVYPVNLGAQTVKKILLITN